MLEAAGYEPIKRGTPTLEERVRKARVLIADERYDELLAWLLHTTVDKIKAVK